MSKHGERRLNTARRDISTGKYKTRKELEENARLRLETRERQQAAMYSLDCIHAQRTRLLKMEEDYKRAPTRAEIAEQRALVKRLERSRSKVKTFEEIAEGLGISGTTLYNIRKKLEART